MNFKLALQALALALLMFRILTDNIDAAESFYDLAFLANRFYARPDLHMIKEFT